jgi:carbamoyltransferase
MDDYHLGINMGHDRSAAVVRGGEILVAIEQERLDRIKHSVGFLYQAGGNPAHIQVPGECIRYCLDGLGLPLGDMKSITANMPGIDYAPEIIAGKFSAEIAPKVKVLPSHHLAHAYSAWWPSGFEETLVLVADATGSTRADSQGAQRTESYTMYVARGQEFEVLHAETVAAHLADLSTLGFIYEYVSRKAGFTTNVGNLLRFPEAGKLMGLAAYGEAQVNWEPWIRPRSGAYSLGISAYDIFLEIAALEKKYDDGAGKPYLRPWLVSLARKAQDELERALVHVVQVAIEQTGVRRLCMAGGVALNSVANYKILREANLEDIYIFPAAGDNGIAAGAALWAYHQDGGSERPRLTKATLGLGYDEDIVARDLEGFEELVVARKLTGEEMLQQTAEAMASGSIVARFEGGGEYGPRALGHRSIIADPIFLRMKDVVNDRVKFREAFRPFAPVIPRERVTEVFDLAVDSPFMLLVSPVREEFKEQLPAITHYDGTGRVQTVTPGENPFFYALCNRLSELRDGPPVLLNTSFNVAGEPIVETPADALRTFLKGDIDYLSLGDYWVQKKHVPVLDYSAHVKLVAEQGLPHGLEPGQLSVRDWMIKLDRALFFGDAELCPWSGEELARLSSQGARYREMSGMLETSPFQGKWSSELSGDVVMLLDPLGESTLVDLTGRVDQRSYRYRDVKLIMAVLNPAEDIREPLRRELRLTHLELAERVEWAITELAAFGVHVHEDWIRAPSEPLDLPAAENPATLAQFEADDFCAGGVLREFNELLKEHGYSEEGICGLLECASLQQIEPTHLHYYANWCLTDAPLDNLIRLFQLRGAMKEDDIRQLFGERLFEALKNLGLLIPRAKGTWASRVDLFCSGGLFFATDHRYMLLDEDRINEDPVMYIGMDSHGLVQTAPRRDAEQLLDLCCGSGIQGVVASRHSGEVTLVDLNPRAIRFSRFNVQLNGVENVKVLCGDLYGVVQGRSFDVILANPPFVPSPNEDYRFRDGGANGECILQRIVEESAGFLAPGGSLFIVTDLVQVDRYDTKLSSWWSGPPADLLVLKTADRNAMLFSVPHSHAPFGQAYESYNTLLDEWVRNFEREQLQAVNFGYILVHSQGSAGGGNEPKGDTTYFCRTVNNPHRPIFRNVEAYFKQRKRLRDPSSADCFLLLQEGLCFNTHSDASGNCLQVELSVPGNEFFTTYQVTESMAVLLREWGQSAPRLGEILSRSNHDWIHDLIFKGILVLSRVQRGSNATGAAPLTEAGSVIVEKETKTTPTCLSSYLQ